MLLGFKLTFSENHLNRLDLFNFEMSLSCQGVAFWECKFIYCVIYKRIDELVCFCPLELISN